MSRSKRGRRFFGFESLSERVVLSSIPIGSLGAEAAGEGETATIEQQGQVLTVIGSDHDDVIEVDLGEAVHKLTVNGEVTEYNVSDVSEIVVAGDGGNDTVSVLGTDQSESVEVKEGGLELRSDTYMVRVSLAENVSANAAGGSDRALLFDSAGDDTIELRSDTATFVDADGAAFTVNGFDRVLSFASNGGNDQATFFDTAAADDFVGKEAFSFMVGIDFWNYARGFESVEVIQEGGGSDTAWLYASSGDDALTATPDEVTLTLANGNTLAAHGFATTRSFAGAGNDTATVSGEDNAPDRFVWDSNAANLTTTRTDSTITTMFTGFEQVKVTGGDDADSAELRGSEAADELIALPEVVQLATPDATVMAHDFRFVVAQGNGGEDFAHLEDSRFNDDYLGKPNFAYMAGPDYLNLITQFEVIDVAATNGGYDFATTQFATTRYAVTGGFASIPDGHLELTSAPGAAIAVFTQSDLDNNRLVYVHDSESPAANVSFDVRIENDLELESSGTISISANSGETVPITSDDISGAIETESQSLLTNFFVADAKQHWIFGETRNERIFGMSRARAIGYGGGSVAPLEHNVTRRNWDFRLVLPAPWEAEIATRNETAVANYDLVDGQLVNVGDAIVNPPQPDV